MIHVPDDWSSGQALLVTSFLDDLVVAIWQQHGAAMGRALRAYSRPGLQPRRHRASRGGVPGHWDSEEAFNVVGFFEHLIEAIWDAHHEEMCDYAKLCAIDPPKPPLDVVLDGEPEFDDDIPF